jgi:hypothetical protein
MTLTSDPVDPAPGPVAPVAPGSPGVGPELPGAGSGSPSTGASSPEALIEEARQHQRRRWLWVGAVALVLVVVAAGLVWAGSTGSRPPAVRTTQSVGNGAGPVRVRSLTIPGPFTPKDIVSAAGRVWLVGTVQRDIATGCAIESVDPATLQTRRYPLASCGDDVAVGGDQVYLATLNHRTDTNTTQVRVERFDPATGQATVLAPVDMTLVGSSRAHTTMIYGDGSLWLWNGDQMDQISPSTGAVVRTVTVAASTESGQPYMVAAGGGLWMAGGPGDSATVDRLAWGANAPSVVYAGPPHGSVLWLSAAGNRVWAAVVTYKDDDQGIATRRLVALDAAGHQVSDTSPVPSSLTAPAGSDSQLWVLGSAGSSCSDPLRLWRIDGTTGGGKAVLTLHTTGEPCLTNSGVTTAGQDVFALVGGGGLAGPAVLYRVTG